MDARAADPDRTWLYRVGGISAVLLAIAYIVTIALYVPIGAPPSNAEAWLAYGADKTTAWWAILSLSVLTDFLFVPVAFALYFALRGVNRDATLLATTFVMLFVVLDLAVTWPNYAALIALSADYAAAATEAQRATYVAAASYATAVVTSTLEGIYSIASLAVGILILGVVMRQSAFNRITAYLAIATGVLGIVSVVGPFVTSALGLAVVLASALTTLWLMFVGYRLCRLAF